MPQGRTVVVERQSQALPALLNVFLPGVGQLIQGRFLAFVGWWSLFSSHFCPSLASFYCRCFGLSALWTRRTTGRR